jgi:hypothetical protein
MNHELPDFEITQRQATGFGDTGERSGEEWLQECCTDMGWNMAITLDRMAWADRHVSMHASLAEWPELIEKFCQQCQASHQDGVQFLLWLGEKYADQLSSPKSKAQGPKSGSGTGCANCGTASRLMANLFKILDYISQHPGPIPVFAALYVFNEPLLDDRIGNHNPAEFAKAIGVSREAVNKEVKKALKFFRLTPRKGMREEAACKNMSEARLKQLKTG